MEPDVSLSWDVMLLVLAGPLGVLAALLLAVLLGVLLSRLLRRPAGRPTHDESFPHEALTLPAEPAADEPAPAGADETPVLAIAVPAEVQSPPELPAESISLDASEPALAVEEPVVQEAIVPTVEPAEVEIDVPVPSRPFRLSRGLGSGVLLLVILLLGGYFRFIGLNWDSNQHLHPDERFVTMVSEQIRPATSLFGLGGYFDTENSALNPFKGGSYTYGMFPLFLTRYLAQWLEMTQYDRVVLVGRVLSGLFDLAAVGLLYLLGTRLYNRRVGLLAAALGAATVMAIQLSHFFTVDSFSTVFIVAGMYVAALVMERGRWWHYALFGALTGLAMACKVTTGPALGLIGVAGLVRIAQAWEQREARATTVRRVAVGWVLAVLMAALFFRVFQPYAFAGPGFWGIKFNERWVAIMREVQNQVSGRQGWPPNHHWTSRPMLSYAWTNLTLWGFGLPLGLAATAGWLWAAWRCWRGRPDWRSHLLPVVWLGGYFVWQNLQFWRYLRYFMPIYPFAALLAAWALSECWDRARAGRQTWGQLRRGERRGWAGAAALLAMALVLVGTYAYAFAFTRIYTRPHTRVEASRWMFQNIPGPLNVMVDTPDGVRQIPIPISPQIQLTAGQSWNRSFVPDVSGAVSAITAMHVSGRGALQVKLSRDPQGAQPLATATWLGEGERPLFTFRPVPVEAGTTYYLTVDVTSGGPVSFGGARLAWETAWDDVLPLRIDGYDPLGGLYQVHNLELFEPDNEIKRLRMLDVLAQADYIVISSNRAYDAMPRLPLSYPMTLAYYQALFDCPEQYIYRCAYPAEPPLSGPLGFELVATFESRPNLGPLTIPDQTAEEAFTVYDHPKVLIFRKSTDFSLAQAKRILDDVDLLQVVEQGPVQYTNTPTGLILPADRLAAQTSGGTWSEMFDTDSALNARPALGVSAWYLLVLVIGWLTFPLLYAALPGLSDRGYPLARLGGLLAVAWLAWMGASLQWVPFTRGALWAFAAGLALCSVWLARRRRCELALFIRGRWRYLLLVEGLFLGLFLLGVAVRWRNPDLWHPWLGGEKPMDLSYFNAVLKSTTFPPYDPWLSGGYLNYYYYGYVLAAVPTKMLGIVPTVAYNLILPTWFALIGVGAFSVAFNLATAGRQTGKVRWAYLAGLTALVLMVLLGNLYQVRLIWQRLQNLGPAAGVHAPWFEQIAAAAQGLQRVLIGEAELISGARGDWYFSASRAILTHSPGTPIVEFPYFSFLYGDLHPHTLDLPVMIAVLAWAVSLVLASGRIGWLGWLLGGLIIGATYPTHTWDFPIAAGLGALAVGYTVWVNQRRVTRIAIATFAGRLALLVGLAFLLYAPFRQWFGSDYVSAELWRGPRTPLGDYLTVHGLFLYLLVTLLAVLSAGWARARVKGLLYTPLGTLVPLARRYVLLVLAAGAAVGWGLFWFWRHDYEPLVVGLPLAGWVAALLLSRAPGVPAGRRIALALVGMAIGLTLVVEVIVLKGDVGRNNTVFKFYLQVWMFLSVAAGAGLAWLLPHLRRWPRRGRRWWLAGLALLVVAAALYPITATPAKTGDRWPDTEQPPLTLDGMAFMLGDGPDRPAIYRDEDRPLDLSRDYAAIRWLQENAAGTPVIVEGQTVEYRWGTRFSVYTGLPTVVGWSWHLRQHNSVVSGRVVEDRIRQVQEFYSTTNIDAALEFLQRYRAEYVVVGELERVYYAAEGLEKFTRLTDAGRLELAFPARPGPQDTLIYRVKQG